MKIKSLLGLSIIIIFLYFFSSLMRFWFVADLIYTLAPLMAVLVGFWTIKIFGLNKQGKPILFLTLGMAAFFIAEIIFIIIENFLAIETTPSVADILFLVAYPLFFIGLFKKIISEKVAFLWKKNFIFLIIAIIFVALFSYFNIYLAYDPEVNFLQNSILISYGIGDIILSICCLFILLITYEYKGGKMDYSWMILTISFLIMLIGDLFFAIFPDKYESVLSLRIFIDILYILSYVLFAIAMLYLINLIKEKQAFFKKLSKE